MKVSLSPAWIYIAVLTAAAAVSMMTATPHPMDDFFDYQHFIEVLAHGRLDLSIPGFHGMNIVAVPWYWLTGSKTTAIDVQMLSGMLLPLFAFLAGRSLLRSTWHGIVFASIIALMPFLAYGSLRGWMVATYNCLLFLSIFLAAEHKRWYWIPWGLSMISLPFAAALLPLFHMLARQQKGPMLRQYRPILFAFAIPILYIALQLLQVGHLSVGVHRDVTAASIWATPKEFFLNAAHTLQIIFSVHNYYFIDPAQTALGNMMQTTPVLIFLALLGLSMWKYFYGDWQFPLACGLGAIIGLGMNMAITHMDHFYMETGIIMLILLALPVLQRLPLWIPLVLATLHFQWLYFYLQFQSSFQLPLLFFTVPVIIDCCFVGYCVWQRRLVYEVVRNWLKSDTGNLFSRSGDS